MANVSLQSLPVIEAKGQKVGLDRECPKITFHYMRLSITCLVAYLKEVIGHQNNEAN